MVSRGVVWYVRCRPQASKSGSQGSGGNDNARMQVRSIDLYLLALACALAHGKREYTSPALETRPAGLGLARWRTKRKEQKTKEIHKTRRPQSQKRTIWCHLRRSSVLPWCRIPVYANELHLIAKCCVRGNPPPWEALRTVPEAGRDAKYSFLPCAHAVHTSVPAWRELSGRLLAEHEI